MFKTCHSDFPKFEVANSLKGIIVDWSDTETKGLRECVGGEVADRLLRGCNVHWARSYQCVLKRLTDTCKWSILHHCKVSYISEDKGRCTKVFICTSGVFATYIIKSFETAVIRWAPHSSWNWVWLVWSKVMGWVVDENKTPADAS